MLTSKRSLHQTATDFRASSEPAQRQGPFRAHRVSLLMRIVAGFLCEGACTYRDAGVGLVGLCRAVRALGREPPQQLLRLPLRQQFPDLVLREFTDVALR